MQKKNDWNDHYELKVCNWLQNFLFDKFPKKVDAVDAHKKSITYKSFMNVKQSDLLTFTLSTALKV